MERLTEHRGKGTIIVDMGKHHESAIRRLAAIEDILGDEYDLDNIAHIRHAAKAESEISATGLMCTACHSDTDADAVYCKYCGARLEG